MEIPISLKDSIQGGEAVLFLGSGASIGSKSKSGEQMPDGATLAKILAEKFLGLNYINHPLAIVAELAISETNLFAVQDYIRELFTQFEPTPFHLKIPSFLWHGIATTNYDLILEKAYLANNKRIQEIVPFIKDDDRVETKLKNQRNAAYVKLHGCITNTHDDKTPLILTIDQFNDFKSRRERLFSMFLGWGYEKPVIFVGSKLMDPDLRQILANVEQTLKESRPRYYIVSPNIPPPEVRYWDTRRITILDGTFEDFITAIDQKIPSDVRGLQTLLPKPNHPINKKFAVTDSTLTGNTLNFLENDVEYIHTDMPIEQVKAVDFYRGYHGKWSPIEQNLDVRRHIGDEIISDIILGEELPGRSVCQLHVLKGYAGAGKTVLLRRIAYDSAIDYDKLCLFSLPHGDLPFEAFREISSKTKERIFLFVDKASEKVNILVDLLQKCKSFKIPLTVIASERTNEWNVTCEPLDRFITNEIEVGYLLESEIISLLDLLERHHSLGTLTHSSPEERKIAFEKRAGRQLLVALHEATLGKMFEEIIENEYNQIKPEQAKLIYLSVSLLYRFDVPVRAGVVSRLFNIRFVDFVEKFFKPLEKVIFTEYDSATRDYVYTTRHSHIAEIVFERILTDKISRLDWYLRTIDALNIAYDADRAAYRRLMRGRSLLDMFPDPKMVESIFKKGLEIARDDSFIHHQMAIYEMNRPNGNLANAENCLIKASSLNERDLSIVHSFVELEIRRAESSSTSLEEEAHLDEAIKIAKRLIGPKASEPHGYHSLGKIYLHKLAKLLEKNDPDFDEITYNTIIRNIEDILQEGFQKFPDDSYLLDAEGKYYILIKANARAFEALKKSFTLNPKYTPVALRLARYLAESGEPGEAGQVYRVALEASPDSKQLHFRFARFLIDTNNSLNREIGREIEYHLKRSFTPGDSNFDAQYWYARQLYIDDHIDDSKKVFNILQDGAISPQAKREIKGMISENDKLVDFTGRVSKKETSYIIISRDGTNDPIFLHISNARDLWDIFTIGVRIRFNIGFTYRGAAGINVRLE